MVPILCPTVVATSKPESCVVNALWPRISKLILAAGRITTGRLVGATLNGAPFPVEERVQLAAVAQPPPTNKLLTDVDY